MPTNLIRDEIMNLLEEYSEAKTLITRLSRLGELLFFGGAIRDYVINKKYTDMPRDFDIAIKFFDHDVNIDFLMEYTLKEYKYKKNRFGGYKILVNNLEFDIWNLNKTWAFQQNLLEAKEENLVKSVYLSIDSIVYNFNQDILHKEKFEKTLNQGIIDTVLENNPQTNLNLLRAIVFKKKYNLEFSQRLIAQFQKASIDNYDIVSELHQLQISHYKNEKLAYDEIYEELELLTNLR